MKKPDECSNIKDIRREIDAIDKEVIAALVRRFAYVKAAAQFKMSKTGVKAPDRFHSMLQERRTWAEEAFFEPRRY